MSRSKLCRLCVNLCKDLKSLYDENGHGNELYEITRKYFHPMILDIEQWKHLTGICLQCWRHICDFHDFQASILVAQLKLVDESTGCGGDGIKKELKEFVEGPSTSKLLDDEEEFISLTEAEKLKATDLIEINNGKALTTSKVPKDGKTLLTLPELDVMDVHEDPQDCSDHEVVKESSALSKAVSPSPSEAKASEFALQRDDRNWSELELSESETEDLSSDDEWVLAKYVRKNKRKQNPDPVVTDIILNDHLSKAADDELSSELTLTDSDADDVLSLNSDASGTTETYEDNSKIRKQKLNDLVAKWIPHVKCCICLEFSTSFSLLQKHFREKHPKEKFSISCCNRKLYAPIRIREHLLLHDDPNAFTCKLCGRYYTTTVTLHGHMALHHPESLEPKKYKCRKCGKSFDSEKRLKHHRKSSHPLLVGPRKPKRQRTANVPPDGPKAFSCTDCAKFFDKYRSFKQHMWYSHRLEPKHKCSVCGKCFKLKYNLRKHITQHADYQCTLCPKAFKDMKDLQDHRNGDHPQEVAGAVGKK